MIILNTKPLHSRIWIVDYLSLSFRSHNRVRVYDLNTFLTDFSLHELSTEDDWAMQRTLLVE